ncbi:deoxynucleoside kinase [Streptococcus suis]|uniref:deoxynucleoside kinase n=1 Tax=Streptococcus suis TaxID=1307 RepID=UPI00192D6DC5|nr:deoxynucleoside kinase [Streptococcus suis]MBL6440120.1 deoxynucleoside kinase [Streptococcus suis]
MFQNIILIAVEGCDGVGKTTMVNLLSKHYKKYENICFVDTATNVKLDEFVSQYRKSDTYDPQLHMYLETLSTYITLLDTIKSKKHLPSNTQRIIVLDRYWYSLLAYPRVLSEKDINESVIEILPRPNYVLYLSGKSENSYRRKFEIEPIEYGRKQENVYMNFCKFQTKVDIEYRSLLNSMKQPFCNIVTDNLSIDEMVQKAICLIDSIIN